jgi:ribosome-associated translation inhibitor RaiA
MEPTEKLREEIARYASDLEERFGRVTACHVVVKAPSEHHRTSGLYEVSIRLALPGGKEVNIARTPRADERHSDIHFAAHDAFKRARRRLQDQARRLQGHVKTHTPRSTPSRN